MTRDLSGHAAPVVLHEAGDHQVANVATEVEARDRRAPADARHDPGRSLDKRPFYRIPRIARLPYSGNALVVYDIGPLRGDLGTPPAPLPRTRRRARGRPAFADGLLGPRRPSVLPEFLKIGGTFVDTCAGKPCYAAGWTGP